VCVLAGFAHDRAPVILPQGNRISVRFEYECHDADGQWWRSHGNEHWEFDDLGYMRRRDASINDYRIDESERRIYVDRD
jgi:nuclear transport factor 2 (NTF2) superfamily protein